MKTFALKFPSFTIALILISSLSVVTSCKKDKETNGKVTVINDASDKISDAEVVVSAASVNGDTSFTKFTNGSGVADFEINLPGIWDVSVTTSDTAAPLVGSGVLRLDEPGSSDDITITVR